VTLLGYIWTNYDNTDPAGYPTLSGLAKAIEGQMTQWYHWYGIRNFFLDGVTSAAGHEPFYARIRTWANTTFRHDTGITPSIWLNPGTYPASSYATIANAILDYEAPTPPPALPAGSWEYRYPATKFINIINDYTGSVPAALSAASAAHAGQVFITSDPDYQKLPSYWDTEAADARASC